MKTLIIGALSLLFISNITKAQDQFKIVGSLPQANPATIVMLSYMNSIGKSVKDSVVIKDGKFTLTGTTAYGNKAYLSTMPVVRAPKVRYTDYKEFYLEKGEYKVIGKDSIAKATITGTQAQRDFLEYTEKTQKLLAQFQEITARFTKVYYAKVKDSVAIKAIQAEARPLHAKIQAALDGFISSHPDSYVTVDLVHDNKMAVIDVNTFEPIYSKLSKRVLSSFTGKKITDKYLKAKQFAVGKIIDFTLPDAKGNEFKLSALKGKYVLVDFWASWCVPCRAENPYLLKAYSELKDRNFEIVGVSLDDTRANWLRAVEADQLPWIQVSDVKGFKTDVAVRFGITAIPQNVLIDPNGKVIAKDLRGEDVNKKIAAYIRD